MRSLEPIVRGHLEEDPCNKWNGCNNLNLISYEEDWMIAPDQRPNIWAKNGEYSRTTGEYACGGREARSFSFRNYHRRNCHGKSRG